MTYRQLLALHADDTTLVHQLPLDIIQYVLQPYCVYNYAPHQLTFNGSTAVASNCNGHLFVTPQGMSMVSLTDDIKEVPLLFNNRLTHVNASTPVAIDDEQEDVYYTAKDASICKWTKGPSAYVVKSISAFGAITDMVAWRQHLYITQASRGYIGVYRCNTRTLECNMIWGQIGPTRPAIVGVNDKYIYVVYRNPQLQFTRINIVDNTKIKTLNFTVPNVATHFKLFKSKLLAYTMSTPQDIVYLVTLNVEQPQLLWTGAAIKYLCVIDDIIHIYTAAEHVTNSLYI